MREDEAIYQISGYVITQTSHSGRNIKRSETKFFKAICLLKWVVIWKTKVSAQVHNILWIIAKSEEILLLKLKYL